MPLPDTVRRRLEVQGFAWSEDPAFERIVPWLRFTPALCTALMAAGTALASPVLLIGLAPIAALGALFPVHPFDLLYNHGVRHLTKTERLPRNGAPRRFACGVATVWLLATGAAFLQGLPVLGYGLGAVLTGVAALVSLTHFCVPSLVYRTLFARGRGAWSGG